MEVIVNNKKYRIEPIGSRYDIFIGFELYDSKNSKEAAERVLWDLVRDQALIYLSGCSTGEWRLNHIETDLFGSKYIEIGGADRPEVLGKVIYETELMISPVENLINAQLMAASKEVAFDILDLYDKIKNPELLKILLKIFENKPKVIGGELED